MVTDMDFVEGGVCAAKGFKAAGVHLSLIHICV